MTYEFSLAAVHGGLDGKGRTRDMYNYIERDREGGEREMNINKCKIWMGLVLDDWQWRERSLQERDDRKNRMLP